MLEIREIGVEGLSEYAQIPIAFEVRSILKAVLIEGGLGGIRLREEAVAEPYLKDYDDAEEGFPEDWLRQFDVSNWGILIARQDGDCMGGVVVAHNTAGVNMLEGRSDLAALWDIRVRPEARRQGVGAQLFQHAAGWARERGCRQLKVETQNVNVPACRFYAQQGCELGTIHRFGYSGHPKVGHEVMLLWYLDL
ncbi:MAG: GNAT family N-acetyltransferase [Anaerolineae bacterium]